MWTQEKINDVLREIQASMPPKLCVGLFKRVKKTPAQEFVVKKALKSKKLDPKKREELELLLKTGQFSKEVEQVDEWVLKKREKYIEKEIKKAIREGRLPTKEEFSKLPFTNITQQYAKKDTE